MVNMIRTANHKKEPEIMTKNMGKLCFACTLIVLLGTVCTFADGSNKSITIAIFPCTDVVASFEKFNPLMAYLKKETCLDLKLTVPKDFETLKRNIENGDISFVFQDPNIYVMLASWYDRKNLIGTVARDGALTQSGVVIVRKDSGIGQLKDLAGKTVMFGPRMSATKWMAATLLFKEKGLDIDTDLNSYSNGTCCEDIAFNVYLKTVDAGIVCDHFLGEHYKKQKELGVDAAEMIVIDRTQSVPTKVFAPRQGISQDIVIKINRALLRLDDKNPLHKDILYSAEIGGFLATSDTDYDRIKMLFRVGTDD